MSRHSLPRRPFDVIPLTLHGLREPIPGPRWQALFEATWPAYRRWFLRDGESARAGRRAAVAALARHMPELVSTWDHLVELAGGGDLPARMLTCWDPPAFQPGCSQAVALTDTGPLLVRNYDYDPRLLERVVFSSAFTGRRVVGTGDCLWGLLDGVNDAGLAVSLAFGGCPGTGVGFGIGLVVRYLLEVCETVADVADTLRRLPVNAAYNLTAVDRSGEHATYFVGPGAAPERHPLAAVTNHRGSVPDWPAYARRIRSVERQEAMAGLLAHGCGADELVAAFLRPPLRSTAWYEGFGTLYTAAYRPADGVVDYVWPDSTWRRSFDAPPQTHTVNLGAGDDHALGSPGLAPASSAKT